MQESSKAATPEAQGQSRVWVLALATFATGTEGYVYAGLLADLAGDLQVTVGRAGLLAAGFAITYALLAPPLAALTASLPRRGVLVGGLAALALVNLLASLSPSFGALLASRVACGIVAAVVGPAATVTAASLVPPERRGRAVALVSAGLALAFTVGVPLGSVVGGAFGMARDLRLRGRPAPPRRRAHRAPAAAGGGHRPHRPRHARDRGRPRSSPGWP